jgi:hypothetical protein
VPNRYRHLARVEVRYAGDLSAVHLVDERTGNPMAVGNLLMMRDDQLVPSRTRNNPRLGIIYVLKLRHHLYSFLSTSLHRRMIAWFSRGLASARSERPGERWRASRPAR